MSDVFLSERLFSVGQDRATSDDVFTPSWLFERLGLRFDLDVAAPPGGAALVPADHFYDQAADGLASPWFGRVWMNPPYSGVTPWVDRFIQHRHGVALVPFARSRWLNRLWDQAEAIALPDVAFRWADGSTISYAVCLAGFGDDCVEAIGRLGVVRVLQ